MQGEKNDGGLPMYERLGATSGKADVHAAVAGTDPGIFPTAFCRIGPDVLGGDPEWCNALHADGAGTKALVAYLHYRETGRAKCFRWIAQDSIVMNLDDLICIGATDRFLLSNAIGRNRALVPGEVIASVVAGYTDVINMLASQNVTIVATGGETADLGDSVRTLVVDSTLATRLRRDHVIDAMNIRPGDVIVGFASTGKAIYETRPNSGIGSNGLTLARHVLLHHDYRDRYPETVCPQSDPASTYRGPFHLDDAHVELDMSIGEALRSPTRTYAPVIKAILDEMRPAVHGIVHNTGGGLFKCRLFGRGLRYVKDHLFPCPPIFSLIHLAGELSAHDMYHTFNMGHRMEMYVAPDDAPRVIELCRPFGIAARVVGRVEKNDDPETNSVIVDGPLGVVDNRRKS